jgi:sulfane dehydrogenase subunit SoxC
MRVRLLLYGRLPGCILFFYASIAMRASARTRAHLTPATIRSGEKAMSNRKPRDRDREPSPLALVAGNGLLHRRALLRGGAAFAGAMAGIGGGLASAGAEPLADDPWSTHPGALTPALQTPSRFESKVVRILSNPNGEPRTQHARTPHQMLNGTVTPNSLHFSILHEGIPDIDPDKHRLVIHGMVKQPLEFSVATLARYPMITRKAFVECGGNSAPLFSPEPIQATLQELHGLVSCAEWTGVPLSVLFDEAGVDARATWFIAEGADGEALSRSVPVKKGLDDAMIALYQNGERLMPGNGYPMRLLLPGYEGNMNVKFLRRIKLVPVPAMSYYEARNYSPLLPGGKAYQFYFINEVKSFITFPSFGVNMTGTGYYQISGLAYSGNGRVAKVLVSADGGTSWGEAALQEPVEPKAFTRFRMPWHWSGGPSILMSRAWDEAGNAQPLRADFVAQRGQARTVPKVAGFPNQHNNTITSWGIDASGEVKHVYA